MKIRARCSLHEKILQAAADGRLEDLLSFSTTAAEKEEASSSSSSSSSLSSLFLQSAVCTSGCQALHWAAGNGHVHVVDALLSPRRHYHDHVDHAAAAAAEVNDDHEEEELQVLEPYFCVDSPAVGKSKGRTALHYACRNGHLDVVQQLIEQYEANPDARAKHGVTPLQLAVWQGRLSIAKYLVQQHQQPRQLQQCRNIVTRVVDPHQTNDFDCGLVHWLGLAPAHAPVVDMAIWLHEELQLPMHHVLQRQGHSPLHKAAWGGHLSLCRYLHETVGLWDDCQDAAGNYAVDLARMAQHKENDDDDSSALVDYLQRVASRTTLRACQILEVPLIVHHRTARAIQRAYREAVRSCHPDGKEKRREMWQGTLQNFQRKEKQLVERFHNLTRAYRHLLACATNDNDDDKLMQNHAAHDLPRLLTHDGSTPASPSSSKVDDDTDCFEARLLQVVRQSRQKGMDLSNLIKKWKQVWPGVDFPKRSQSSLQQWIRQEASHVVTVRADDQGVLRLYPRFL